jgi:hypothetical protein
LSILAALQRSIQLKKVRISTAWLLRQVSNFKLASLMLRIKPMGETPRDNDRISQAA